MRRRPDMVVYDERERYPASLYALAILLASPFIYIAVSRVALIYLTRTYQCTFVDYGGSCPLFPEIAPVFSSLTLLHTIYGRIVEMKPELKYLQLLLYVAAVLIAFLPFALRNYRAGAREFFLLAFLAAGAFSTLLVN